MNKLVKPALVAAAFMLAGAPAIAQELRIGFSSEPSSIDPHYHNLSPNNMLAREVFQPLVGQDKNQRLLPGLAESWRAVNDTTWEFKLRRNVRFHDGSPLTVDDVLASVARLPKVPRSPSSFTTFTAGMTFEKVDDHTFIVKTATPAPLVPTNLSAFGIISRACAEMSTEDFNAARCKGGTGPFMYEAFRPGDRVTMVRNPNFWGERPAWERVTVRFFTSAPTRVAAILAGDVDVIADVPPADVARLKANAQIEVASTLSNRVIYFHMDHFREQSPFITAKDGSAIPNPLRDVRVRRALSMAINRQAIVERIMEGEAVPAGQLLAENFFGTSKTLKPPAFDLQGARRLLAEAGFPNGFKMKMHGPNGRYVNDTKIIEAVAQMFTRLGLDVEIETMPPANFFTRASTGGPNNTPEFSFILVGWGSSTGETSGSLVPLVGTVDRARGSGSANRGRYSNPQLDAILTQATSTVDDARRDTLLGQAMDIAMTDVGVIPTHFQLNTWAVRRPIKLEARADEYTLPSEIKPR